MDWQHLRASHDPSILPVRVDEMLQAQTEEEAGKAYWQIENNAFSKRELYEAAEPTTALIVERIIGGRWTQIGLLHGLDLLVEIMLSHPAQSEQMLGNIAIDQRCRGLIKDLLPYLYSIIPKLDTGRALSGVADLAADLEDSSVRRRWLADTLEPRANDRFLSVSLKFLKETLENTDEDAS